MNRAVIMWRLASFAVAAGFIALWQLIANLKLVSPVFLPGPDRAWASLVRGFSSGDLWSKLAGTLEHMAYGWLAASIAGIAIGAIIGSSRTMRTIRPIWLHPTDRSQGLILGTDKHADGALSLPGSWRWRFPALWAKLSSQEAPMKVPLALLFLFGLRLGF